jgi:hypothetical protein
VPKFSAPKDNVDLPPEDEQEHSEPDFFRENEGDEDEHDRPIGFVEEDLSRQVKAAMEKMGKKKPKAARATEIAKLQAKEKVSGAACFCLPVLWLTALCSGSSSAS